MSEDWRAEAKRALAPRLLLLAAAVGTVSGAGGVAFRLLLNGIQWLAFGSVSEMPVSALAGVPDWRIVAAPALGGLARHRRRRRFVGTRAGRAGPDGAHRAGNDRSLAPRADSRCCGPRRDRDLPAGRGALVPYIAVRTARRCAGARASMQALCWRRDPLSPTRKSALDSSPSSGERKEGLFFAPPLRGSCQARLRA